MKALNKEANKSAQCMRNVLAENDVPYINPQVMKFISASYNQELKNITIINNSNGIKCIRIKQNLTFNVINLVESKLLKANKP